jgi:crotonobetainyl-CoA:carnitine CoA-transferase CaiB-like acyl-CoA transferase
MRVRISIADLTAGLFASQGIKITLVEREQLGKEKWLHTYLLQAKGFMLNFLTARWLVDGRIPE